MMIKNMKRIVALLFIFLTLTNCPGTFSQEDTSVTFKQHVEQNIYKDNSDPISYFSFNDLMRLSQQAKLDPDLELKLNEHLSMVFLVNRKTDATLDKPYIRIAHWNINRGLNADAIKSILITPYSYEAKHLKDVKKRLQKHFKEELQTLAAADI